MYAKTFEIIFGPHGHEKCRTRECTFSYYAAILVLVTVEDWGEEKCAEGVDVKWKKGALPPHPPSRLFTSPLPVKHPITIQDGDIETWEYMVYWAFRSKIMSALQAERNVNVLTFAKIVKYCWIEWIVYQNGCCIFILKPACNQNSVLIYKKLYEFF